MCVATTIYIYLCLTKIHFFLALTGCGVWRLPRRLPADTQTQCRNIFIELVRCTHNASLGFAFSRSRIVLWRTHKWHTPGRWGPLLGVCLCGMVHHTHTHTLYKSNRSVAHRIETTLRTGWNRTASLYLYSRHQFSIYYLIVCGYLFIYTSWFLVNYLYTVSLGLFDLAAMHIMPGAFRYV